MSMRPIIRWGAGAALAGALVVGSGAGAFAHECFNASRSAQGNTSAGGFITQKQADCILEEYAATGAPSSFTVHVKGANGNDGTLASKNPNQYLKTNHKGVDTIFAAWGDEIFGSYAACGATLGGE